MLDSNVAFSNVWFVELISTFNSLPNVMPLVPVTLVPFHNNRFFNICYKPVCKVSILFHAFSITGEVLISLFMVSNDAIKSDSEPYMNCLNGSYWIYNTFVNRESATPIVLFNKSVTVDACLFTTFTAFDGKLAKQPAPTPKNIIAKM